MNKQRPHIVVVGSLNMDMVVRTEIAPLAGESIIGQSFTTGMGGKGANQAVAAARMGGRVTMVGKLGHDSFGAQMLSALDQEGINTEHVIYDLQHPTGMAFITLEASGQNRIICIPGANLAFAADELEGIYAAIREADLLLVQLEINLDIIEKAIAFAHAQGIPVILNPGPKPAHALADHLLAMLDCITPNESEAEALTGLSVESRADAEAAGKALLAKGVKRVAVTMGKMGALLMEGGEAVFVPGYRVKAVDTVAAGDTFTGALAVELSNGSRFEDAARFAGAAAAIAVTREGAMQSIPTRAEVEAFIRTHHLEA